MAIYRSQMSQDMSRRLSSRSPCHAWLRGRRNGTRVHVMTERASPHSDECQIIYSIDRSMDRSQVHRAIDEMRWNRVVVAPSMPLGNAGRLSWPVGRHAHSQSHIAHHEVTKGRDEEQRPKTCLIFSSPIYCQCCLRPREARERDDIGLRLD
jgi:hypothetical protein